MSVESLIGWRDDGTLERIDRARRERTPVRIRRSPGDVHDALIASCAGCGGLFCVVAWHDDGLDKTAFRVDVGADGVLDDHVSTLAEALGHIDAQAEQLARVEVLLNDAIGEVNDAIRDNGVNLEVKPWPAESAARAHCEEIVQMNREFGEALREGMAGEPDVEVTVTDDGPVLTVGKPSGVPDAPGWWWRNNRPTEVWLRCTWPGDCESSGDLLAEDDDGEVQLAADLGGWGGPCTRGDVSKLQAEISALRERLGELADGLQCRRSTHEGLANSSSPMTNVSRALCSGKASAYGHAAELLREALREDS